MKGLALALKSCGYSFAKTLIAEHGSTVAESALAVLDLEVLQQYFFMGFLEALSEIEQN